MKMNPQDVSRLSDTEHIRLRPGMYVGDTQLWGLIQYFVYAVSLLLGAGARRISLNLQSGIELDADAIIPIDSTSNNLIRVFETIRSPTDNEPLELEGIVVNALSKSLDVFIDDTFRSTTLRFERGRLTSRESGLPTNKIGGTRLRLLPDDAIFEDMELSPAALESYFRRLSFIHHGVCFAIKQGNSYCEYKSENGFLDLFQSISSPYQLMHEPIHFMTEHNKLRMEVIMAYHSWSANHLCIFVNNGRSVNGGTHEEGFMMALKQIKKKINMPKTFSNGVVALAFMHYPDMIWQGCIKDRVANPELKELVAQLVMHETVNWLQGRPKILMALKKTQTFIFPEIWKR